MSQYKRSQDYNLLTKARFIFHFFPKSTREKLREKKSLDKTSRAFEDKLLMISSLHIINVKLDETKFKQTTRRCYFRSFRQVDSVSTLWMMIIWKAYTHTHTKITVDAFQFSFASCMVIKHDLIVYFIGS